MRRLRTQIIAAFVVLSVVPLTAIVTFGYYTSERTFRRAVEHETSTLASQMDRRVNLIAETVGRDMERVGSLPIETILAGADSGNGQLPEKLRVVLGDNAELLTINVVPDAPAAPADPAEPAMVSEVAVAPPAASPQPLPSVAPVAAATPAPRVAPVPPVASVPTAPPAPEPRQLDPATRAEIDKAIAQTHEAIQVAVHARNQTHAQALEQLRARLEEQRAAGRMPDGNAVMKLHAKDFATSIVKDGETIGQLHAQLRGDEVVRRIVRGSASQEGDLVFAVDHEGTLFAASDEEKKKIEAAGLDAIARGAGRTDADWVVASSPAAEAGVSFAIARPISESLREMREAAARNFAFGLALIGFALIGIVPLANHIARDIETVTDAAEQIAQGKLDTEVRVGSKNEIGKLAAAFNGMARDLRQNQERLLDEERSRREQEIEQRLLAAQYERKSAELEEARRFQLSLLPSSPPQHPELDVASYVHTATEVGGDYWDYLLAPDGTLTLVIGDATGHGARAGTMVTVVKSLFATFTPEDTLSEFLERANQSIRRMGLERMAMALTLARFRPGIVEIAAAGMPPVLIHRAATDTIEDIAIEAPPLGTLAFTYGERSIPVTPGDTLLLMTDGFPELQDPAGDPLGYAAAQDEFAAASKESPRGILDRLSAKAEAWTAGAEPADDITFVAVKVR
jgi:serine phosphatase RsbU (regulator of sigma subunit)